MKVLLQVVSAAGLLLVVAPVLAYVFGSMDKATMSMLMLVGTLAWFGSVPFWMGRRSDRTA